MQPPQAVLVAYRSPLWLKVAIGSFRSHFPAQKILVVDNNPRRSDPDWQPECEEERQWLADHPSVCLLHNPGSDRTHGAGMDMALEWCREHDVTAMLHFEPDCYVAGRKWYRELTDAIDRGAWMAACHRKAWGPLHPCPSIWDLKEVRASFGRSNGQVDVGHPRFSDVFDSERYRLETGVDARTEPWTWDTGLKAWFEAAIADRAVEVSGDGFHHYWRGSTTRRDDLALFLNPKLIWYARPSMRVYPRAVAGNLVARIARKFTERSQS